MTQTPNKPMTQRDMELFARFAGVATNATVYRWMEGWQARLLRNNYTTNPHGDYGGLDRQLITPSSPHTGSQDALWWFEGWSQANEEIRLLTAFYGPTAYSTIRRDGEPQ